MPTRETGRRSARKLRPRQLHFSVWISVAAPTASTVEKTALLAQWHMLWRQPLLSPANNFQRTQTLRFDPHSRRCPPPWTSSTRWWLRWAICCARRHCDKPVHPERAKNQMTVSRVGALNRLRDDGAAGQRALRQRAVTPIAQTLAVIEDLARTMLRQCSCECWPIARRSRRPVRFSANAFRAIWPRASRRRVIANELGRG